jgi:hypothetical protein
VLPYWATWFAYQIGRNAGSAAITRPSLTNQSLSPYKLLSGPASDTILAIRHKKLEVYILQRSENTEWPTTEGGPLPDPIQYIFAVFRKSHVIIFFDFLMARILTVGIGLFGHLYQQIVELV